MANSNVGKAVSDGGKGSTITKRNLTPASTSNVLPTNGSAGPRGRWLSRLPALARSFGPGRLECGRFGYRGETREARMARTMKAYCTTCQRDVPASKSIGRAPRCPTCGNIALTRLGKVVAKSSQASKATPKAGSYCGQCGRAIGSEDHFCGGCGAPARHCQKARSPPGQSRGRAYGYRAASGGGQPKLRLAWRTARG